MPLPGRRSLGKVRPCYTPGVIVVWIRIDDEGEKGPGGGLEVCFNWVIIVSGRPQGCRCQDGGL